MIPVVIVAVLLASAIVADVWRVRSLRARGFAIAWRVDHPFVRREVPTGMRVVDALLWGLAVLWLAWAAVDAMRGRFTDAFYDVSIAALTVSNVVRREPAGGAL